MNVGFTVFRNSTGLQRAVQAVLNSNSNPSYCSNKTVFELKTIAVFTVLFAATFGQVQRAVLYDQYNSKGDYIVIPEDEVKDLGKIGFDNRPRSACVTGIWLLYQDIDFNPAGGRGIECIFGRNNYCVDLQKIAGSVSSVRFAGRPKDYRTDSLTLYQHVNFQGAEEDALDMLPNLNLIDNHKSIIITGSSPWTVFNESNYKGNSVCLRVPEPGTPAFIADLENSNLPIPHGSIRSLKKGCSSSTSLSVTLSSFSSTSCRKQP